MNQSTAENPPPNPEKEAPSSTNEKPTETETPPAEAQAATGAPQQTEVGANNPLVSDSASTPVTPNDPEASQPNLDLIMKIPVNLQVILGTTKMPVSKLMKLGRNAVIALDRQVGDPIDVVVNGRTVARGEVVLMEDDSSRFGISLTEIVGPDGPAQ